MESQANFVGAVELSVHLSSMNPLGYIDENEAHLKLERAILKACGDFYKHRDDTTRLINNTIVPLGTIQKYFHFCELTDALDFSQRLRAILLEAHLPFKICVSEGEITTGGLDQEWLHILTKKQEDLSDKELKQLDQQFSTDDIEKARWLSKVYGSPSFKNDVVQLGLDLQNFKGLGLHLSDEIKRELNKCSAKPFHNAYPLIEKPRSFKFVIFIDLKFDFSDSDVVYRFREDSNPKTIHETKLGSESQLQIDGLFNMLSHSHSARRDSSVFYVSALTNLVRSSYFSRFSYCTEDSVDARTGTTFVSGWQFFPPIFAALFDPAHKAKLKGMPGIELVLAELLDEVFAALTGTDPSSGIDVAHAEFKKTKLDDDQKALVEKLLVRIHAQYGDGLLRKIYVLPDEIIHSTRKKEILKFASE